MRISETTSSQRHLEDLARRDAAFHPRDPVREFHFPQQGRRVDHRVVGPQVKLNALSQHARDVRRHPRSEEHTSELQSRGHLVCRLLLEKKKKTKKKKNTINQNKINYRQQS